MPPLRRMFRARRRMGLILFVVLWFIGVALFCLDGWYKSDENATETVYLTRNWTSQDILTFNQHSPIKIWRARVSPQIKQSTFPLDFLRQNEQRRVTEAMKITFNGRERAELYWKQNNLTNQREQTADHDHVHKNSPQVSLQRYIRLDDTNIEPFNSWETFSSTFFKEQEAVTQCELINERCEAILKRTLNNTDSFTLASRFTLLPGGNCTLFVKPEFTANLEYSDTEVTCAVQRSKPQSVKSPIEGCQLPVIDPFDKASIIYFLKLVPMTCEGVLFTSYHDGLLEVITNHDRGAPLKSLSFQTIHRNKASDYGFKLSENKPLKYREPAVPVRHDFIQVNAQFTNGEIQTDFHAQVTPKRQVLKRKAPNKPGIPLNIMIVGLDQTSHATFQRLLPEPFKFLRDDLQAFMFEGFSLVGEGTTPQLTALLTGKTVEENCKVHEARTGFDGAGTVDEWPFIFKTLKSYGYATMFSEDSPSIGAFNMRLNGFSEPPCDHYARPFWSAVPHTSGGVLHENCINSKPQHVLQFEYLKSLFTAYPKTPKFGFIFLSSLCHQETIMPLSSAADNIYDFFKSIRDSGVLNDTMLVVMGDHGARTGEFRSTLQGKIEERLPFLSIVLPKFFHKRYPDFVKNLKRNSRKIISPLDLHATFLHVLKYPLNPSKSALTRGSSLFSNIPQNRTCDEANIPEYFCPCVDWLPLNITHAHVVMSVQHAADHINSLLSDDVQVFRLCARLKVDKILDAWQESPSFKLQTYNGIPEGDGLGIGKPDFQSSLTQSECSYQVKFRTVPGYGVFEASVKLVNGKFIVNEHISRISIYGSQPDCIKASHPHLRKFCYCRHDD